MTVPCSPCKSADTDVCGCWRCSTCRSIRRRRGKAYAQFRKELLQGRLYADAVFGLCSALPQRGKRRRFTSARVEKHGASRWRSSDHHAHRQTVRADAHFLGKNAQSSRSTARRSSNFSSANASQVVASQSVGGGSSVTNLSPRPIRNLRLTLPAVAPVECNQSQPATNPQQAPAWYGACGKCNQSQPATNPQRSGDGKRI